jgi:hypothetical protein
LTVEHPFDIVDRTVRQRGRERCPKFVSWRLKQPTGIRRLTAMKRESRRLLAITVRTGLMVGLALILILVLLPAVLAAQAAGLR